MPTQGVPSTRPISNPNPEAYDKVSKLGLDRALGGCIYNQYANTAAINTSTTQTSIFNESATSCYGSRVLPANFWAWFPRYYDQVTPLPGAYVRGKVWGTIGNNTSTPNLTILVGLWVAGTFRSIASTGTFAMISTAAVLVPFQLDFFIASRTLGAAATCAMIANFTFQYNVTNLVTNEVSTITTGGNIEVTNMVSTVETIIDIQQLWGTSHALNNWVTQGAIIESIG
jgi:hypothetical protein